MDIKSRTIAGIPSSFARYTLTLRSVTCQFDGEAFVYRIVAARRNTGTRGGGFRSLRVWTVRNIPAEDRARLALLPRQLDQTVDELDRALNVPSSTVK